MNIKQELFWGVVGGALIILLTLYFVNSYSQLAKNVTNNSASTTSLKNPTTALTNQNTLLTSLEIAKHNSSNDCWIIIDGNVYEVTNYIKLHPGGPQALTYFCGTDASNGYNTQGGKGKHSLRAKEVLKLLLLGGLKGPVVNQPAQIEKQLLQIPKNDQEDEDD